MKQSRVPHTSQLGKANENFCIKQTIATTALDRVLKHHAKHCAYWIFSGDRHCSCGRDKAILEFDKVRGRLRAVINMSGDRKEV